MLARRHVRAPARCAALAAAMISLYLADQSAASVTSIGSVNPVPPATGGTFTSAWVVGDQQAANPNPVAWVNITNGTLLGYKSLIIGDEGLYLGTVNVVGDFLAGKNTTLTLSASLAGNIANNPTLQVGRWGTGYLNIRGGATVALSSSFSDMSIGHKTTGIGYVTVSDPFSVLTLSEDLFVGNAGIGRLEVLDGALVRTTSTSTSHDITIGAAVTGVGTVVVDGLGSVLRAGSRLVVGGSGAGNLTISNQAIVDVDNVTGARTTVGPLGRLNLAGGTLIGLSPTSDFGTTVNGVFGGSGLVRGSVGFGAAGSLEVGPGDLLQFTGNVSNQGAATIDRGEVQFLAGFTNNAQGVLAAPGRISLEDGTVRFSQAQALINNGVLSSARGTNNVHGQITNTNQGTIVVASDTVATFHDHVDLDAGMLKIFFGGNALFLADLVFEPTSALQLGIGMSGTAITSAKLGVAAAVSLGGSLTVNLDGSFTPTLGQTFELITADSGIAGTFSSIAVPDIPGPNEYRVVYNPTSVRLVVADELSSSMPGDFNGDFVVDAGDYVVWRNDPTRTQAQYDLWREHFGSAFGGGAGSLSDSGGGTVPEPGSGVLFVGGLLIGGRMLYLRRRIDSSATSRFCFSEVSKACPSCPLKVVAPCCVSISTARS